ncbi:Short-chain dehydrogenase TIC 32, chloroplastic 6 [Colletotrichum chlorophyti]|uniref:Short-chain dehydrogenase TIC 32, chloroplastic 6 n=1 Tax=Colletotrichum chlorophyti TaxID=708187 RepID=A0A1Q8RN01_9PEZI|nr:Short-chain dehydrogenase TIC 32, chloroplastic 6 [Colletotrichum chlorophyti]
MSRYASAHEHPHGAGDARPTALKIIEDEGLVGKLADKTVLITGANQGIGLETARALHATGATVFLGVRNLERGRQAIADIQTPPNPAHTGALHLVEMSLDSLASVRKGAQDFLLRSGGKLNILVLNAGIMTEKKGQTVDGFETQFGTNHLGHFLLFQLLKSALLDSATPEFHSRVVAVSSMMHKVSGIRFDDYNFDKEGSYDIVTAYGQTKTANIYLANEIERRYGARGLHGLSLHPGIIMTNMSRPYLGDDDTVRAEMGEKQLEILRRVEKSPTQGAATTVYAAVSKEWEGRGGRYLSDCVEAAPGTGGSGVESWLTDTGYSAWIYDEEKAARLWKESCKMVGIEDGV